MPHLITKTVVSDSTTTPDEATYIARHLGAQHLPLTTIIPISVVYSTIFIGQAHSQHVFTNFPKMSLRNFRPKIMYFNPVNGLPVV